MQEPAGRGKEGKEGGVRGEGGGWQKHTSGIRKTLQTLGKPHREKRTGHVVDGGSGEKGALLCFLRYHRGGRSHGRQPPPENKSLSEKKQEERREEKQQFSIWWGIKRRNSRLLCSSERWANKGGLLPGDGRWRGGWGVGWGAILLRLIVSVHDCGPPNDRWIDRCEAEARSCERRARRRGGAASPRRNFCVGARLCTVSPRCARFCCFFGFFSCVWCVGDASCIRRRYRTEIEAADGVESACV